MAIVYQYIRLDTNEVFYIGIGKTLIRSSSKANRNKYWKNVVNKHNFKNKTDFKYLKDYDKF